MAFADLPRPAGWSDADPGPPERVLRLVRRSTLIMPVNVRRFVEKAHTRGADAILLDLEDSIPDAEKAAARTCVAEAVAMVRRGGADVLVRINKPWRHLLRDLEAAVIAGVTGLVLPKTESAEEVRILDGLLRQLEQERGLAPLQLACNIETAAGVPHADAIATASPRVATLSLGTEDFTLDLGVEPSDSGDELFFGKAWVILAARRAGVQAQGLMGSVAGFHGLDLFGRIARRARQMGCWGASCIHPAQVPVLNDAFSPDPAAVDHARRVVQVYYEAEAQGRASVALDGKMIDIPVVRRAERLLVRAGAIAAMETRKRETLA